MGYPYGGEGSLLVDMNCLPKQAEEGCEAKACTSQKSHPTADSEGIGSTTGFGLKGQPGFSSWTGSGTLSAQPSPVNPLCPASEPCLCVAGAATAARGAVP